LEEAPYRFNFFQAVRLLEQVPNGAGPAESPRKPVGREHAPRDEAVRFRAFPSHTFPPSEIASLDCGHGTEVPDMVVAFMGMTGPSGVLPHHYTQLVIDRLRFKDHALRDMLDVFNHRATSLFYRAWRKYRFYVEFEREAKQHREDQFTACLYSLIGYGTAHLRKPIGNPRIAFVDVRSDASRTAGLAAAGVLDEAFPTIEGVCKPGSGYVFKPELTNNNPKIQNLLYSGRLPDFYTKFFGENIRHYDFTWLRAIGPGKGTNPHCRATSSRSPVFLARRMAGIAVPGEML